jgi:hypothetical protein
MSYLFLDKTPVIASLIGSGFDAAGVPIQHRMVVLGMQVYFFHEILINISHANFHVVCGF